MAWNISLPTKATRTSSSISLDLGSWMARTGSTPYQWIINHNCLQIDYGYLFEYHFLLETLADSMFAFKGL